MFKINDEMMTYAIDHRSVIEKDYKKTLVYEQIEMIKNHYNDLE